MSHTVKLKTQLTCLESIKRACKRMPGVEFLGKGTFRVYSGNNSGIGIQLPGWQYPITIDIESGELAFDNYGGRWGNEEVLDGFRQAYGVEKAKLEGQNRGYSVQEETLANGDIKVTLNVGGGTGLAADGDPMSGGYGVAGSNE